MHEHAIVAEQEHSICILYKHMKLLSKGRLAQIAVIAVCFVGFPLSTLVFDTWILHRIEILGEVLQGQL